MPKIESIRPGGTLDGSLGEYLLADLLLGLLRGNLTGRLDLALGKEPRNHVFFKDGVPVSVTLPDLGVSVARILAERGELPKERVAEIVAEAEGAGRSESAVLVQGQILTTGTVDEGRRRRAREQMVRLFDAGDVPFLFVEGASLPIDAVLTILQPLPLVYEGLSKSTDRRVVERFLAETSGASFKLAATYPHGVDPFEWGPHVEAAIQRLVEPRALDELVELGLPRDRAAVALTTLFLAGMVEVQRVERPRVRASSVPGEGPLARAESVGAARPAVRAARFDVPRVDLGATDDREPSGLVVHRRSGAGPLRAPSIPDLTKEPAPREPLPREVSARDLNGTRPISRLELGAASAGQGGHAASAGQGGHAAQVEQLAQRLGTLRGKSYFKMLRLVEGSPVDQIERSYKHLARQLDEAVDDAGNRALKEALKEAYEVLVHPVDGRRYRELADRAKQSPGAVAERQAFEAPPKIERALVAMAEGRTGEAAYLLEWAQALDPTRKDIRVYRALLGYFRAPRAHRTGEALALKPLVVQELQRTPNDPRLSLVLALVLAEEGEPSAVEKLLTGLPDPEHPLARRVLDLLSAS